MQQLVNFWEWLKTLFATCHKNQISGANKVSKEEVDKYQASKTAYKIEPAISVTEVVEVVEVNTYIKGKYTDAENALIKKESKKKNPDWEKLGEILNRKVSSLKAKAKKL